MGCASRGRLDDIRLHRVPLTSSLGISVVDAAINSGHALLDWTAAGLEYSMQLVYGCLDL